MNRLTYTLATTIALFFTSAAQAQARWALGLGAEFAPDFPTASDESVTPTPLIDRLKEGESLYADLKSGPRIDLFEADNFEAGLALNFDPGRDTDDLPTALIGLGEVDLAVELGAFAAYEL